MSRYFEALNRLRRKAPLKTGTAARNIAVDHELPDQPQALEPDLSIPDFRGHIHSPYATLLDNLRARTGNSPIIKVVFASVSSSETLQPVIEGVAEAAQQRGLSVGRGALVISSNNRTLSKRPPARGRSAAADPRSPLPSNPPPLQLGGPPKPKAVRQWLDEASAMHDLLLIQAPPIMDTVDGALLGKECNGLVLTVQSRATEVASLLKAVERLRLAECSVLGLVVSGTTEWLPRWIVRIFSQRHHD